MTTNSIILKDDKIEGCNNYSFFPIQYPQLESFYQRQKQMFWTPQADVDMSGDRDDWDKLDGGTKNAVKFVLCFFAQLDGLVNENLIDNFKRETSRYKEAQYFYAAQEFIEVIHNETYSLLIDTFMRDEKEKDMAFNAINSYPAIGNIAKWAKQNMNPSIPLTERVIAFACLEGIIFQFNFAIIYWVKRRNILNGLCESNSLIARDEALHTEFAVVLYIVISNILKHYPEVNNSKAHEIIKSAVSLAEDLAKAAVPEDLIGINADDLIKYTKCAANSLSTAFGFGKIYDVENPFIWMAVISLPNKTNFFERNVTEYAKQSEGDFTFDLDTEF